MNRTGLYRVLCIAILASAPLLVRAQAWENRNALKLVLPSNSSDPSKTLTILAPSITGSSFSWTLPDGNTSGVLQNNGSGILSWVSVLSNPMTTAGDIIFENSTPAAARLAIGSPNQALVVSGSNLPAWANIVNSLSGTTNQVSVTASTGSITLSTPQNIHTGATPQFASMTLANTSNQLLLGSTNTATISASAP